MRSPQSLRKGLGRSAVVLGLVAVLLAFCAQSALAASTTTTTTPRPAFSTASGTVAALSSATSSMEVQSPTSGQVTVSWTSTTRFSETVTVASSQLSVGDCVTVSSTSKKKTGSIAATTVSLRPSTGGSCTGAGGFGFGTTTPPTGAGGFRGGFGGSFPRGTFPGGSFPRSGSGARRFGSLGRFATGKVISKTGSSFVVKGFEPQPPKKDPANSTKTRVTTTSTTRPATVARKAVKTTVTFNAKTKFTTTQPASAATLAVGVCATALGPANDIGAITASTISITPAPKSGGCTAAGGFGGFFGGAGG